MKTKDYTASFTVDQSPEEVFDAVARWSALRCSTRAFARVRDCINRGRDLHTRRVSVHVRDDRPNTLFRAVFERRLERKSAGPVLTQPQTDLRKQASSTDEFQPPGQSYT